MARQEVISAFHVSKGLKIILGLSYMWLLAVIGTTFLERSVAIDLSNTYTLSFNFQALSLER